MSAGAFATLGVMTDFTSALGGTFINPFVEYKQARDTGQGGSGASLAAAGSVGKGFASMGTSITKGTLVSFPLAIAEGLRNTPKLYGDEVKKHEPVTDSKSGVVVAGKVRVQHPAPFPLPITNSFRISASASMRVSQTL